MTTERTTTVRLRFPTFRRSLQLRRVPKYLRFVCANISKPGREWDVLDQLDDQPKPEEEIIAAVLVDWTRMHLDGIDNKTGKRWGKWINEAVYEPTTVQPPDETLRDTSKWQAWCDVQLRKGDDGRDATESPAKPGGNGDQGGGVDQGADGGIG